VISEDFMGGPTLLDRTSTNLPVGAATCVDLSGSLSQCSRIVESSDRAGVVEVSASETDGYCRIDTQETFYQLQQWQFTFDVFVRIPTLGHGGAGAINFEAYCGWGVGNIGTGSAHFALTYNYLESPNWIFKWDSGGSEVTFNTGKVVNALQWYRFTFTLNGTNLSVAIDQVAVHSVAYPVASSTGSQFTPVGVTCTLVGTPGTADCDKYNLWTNAVAPRSAT
jgi:hypothetical protein